MARPGRSLSVGGELGWCVEEVGTYCGLVASEDMLVEVERVFIKVWCTSIKADLGSDPHVIPRCPW